MKYLYVLFIAFFSFTVVEAQQTVAICKEKQGCEIARTNLSRAEIDQLLGKQNFLTKASKNAVLVLNDCNATIDGKRTTLQIHQAFGGKATPKILNAFNLKNYLVLKNCIQTCLNLTKKISFKLTSNQLNSSGYFFANLKADEAFMPNASFQQLYLGQGGFSGLTMNAFFKDFKYISYTIDPEGGKYKTNVPIGADIADMANSVKNETRFKKDFKPTGKKRPHLATKDFQYEYVGKDDEGNVFTFWLGPAYDVCLPKGKFNAPGFWNLGYIAFDGKTYLIAEISGSGVKVTVTNVVNGNYSFNPAGYKTISMTTIK